MLSSLRFSLFFTALLIHPEEPGFENQIDQIPEQEQQDKRMFFPLGQTDNRSDNQNAYHHFGHFEVEVTLCRELVVAYRTVDQPREAQCPQIEVEHNKRVSWRVEAR